MKEDCFYFLTSECARQASCTFRHSETAKASTEICGNWMDYQECHDDCPKRHSNYKPHPKVAECYWESHGGCKKDGCPYAHKAKKEAPKPAATRIKTLEELQQEYNEIKQLSHYSSKADTNPNYCG